MIEQIDTMAALEARLAEVLARWPLYRSLAYQGKECHLPAAYTSNRFAALPAELRLFCKEERCRQETWWEIKDPNVFFASQHDIRDRKYTCKNCGRNSIHYLFYWQEQKANNFFLKVGQHPELEERVPDALEQTLGAADLKMYKNALRLRNFNLGIAAVAYMRRVVENRLNDMLEILHEAAIAHNAPADLLALHEEMKQEKRFSAKIDYAGNLLPKSLRPDGKPNPMAILHELQSEGLHAKADDECVDIFDACRKTFEFVFGKLRIETEDARTFVREMAPLTERKGRAEPADASGKSAK